MLYIWTLDIIQMNYKSRLSAISIFEYTFKILEKEMYNGTESIDARKEIKILQSATIEKLLIQCQIIKENDNFMISQSIPAIIILSLCNELALKSLIHQDTGTDKRGHKLGQLLSELSTPYRDGIKQIITRLIKRY